MVLAQWDDGYVLEVDPRREDPLYYYVIKDGWKNAVGIQIAPIYGEHAAKEVTISIFASHRDRPGVTSLEDRQRMFLRALPVILARFPGWQQVTLKDDLLPAMLADAAFTDIFTQAGYQSSGSGATEQTWKR